MLTKFLNNYGYMILGGAMIFGFSAFKSAEVYSGKKLSPVMVYFHGDVTDPAEVADESLWTTTPNEGSCNNVNQRACSQEVDELDLNSNDEINPSKIQLGATSTPQGYIPSRTGGTSTSLFKPINKGATP